MQTSKTDYLTSNYVGKSSHRNRPNMNLDRMLVMNARDVLENNNLVNFRVWTTA